MRSEDDVLNDMIRNPDDGVELLEVGAAEPGPRHVYTQTSSQSSSSGWWLRLMMIVGWTVMCLVGWMVWGSSALVLAAADGVAGGLSMLLITGIVVGTWLAGLVAMASISIILR
jgi:hypothetical protein